MKFKPITYRNISLILWCVMALSLIICICTKSDFFDFLRYLVILPLLLFIYKYHTEKEKYIMVGDFKKIIKHQINNGCFQCARRLEKPSGVVVSCTDDGNGYLSQYIDCPEELGAVNEASSWDKRSNTKLPHDFIGYDKKGEIVVVNTLPYSFCTFNCGMGEKGSCDDSYLKISVCYVSNDDEYFDKYFKDLVFGAAVQQCAALCKKNKLKPNSVISDKEAYGMGMAGNCSSFEQWLIENGRSMEEFRNSVKDRLKGK